MGEGNVISLSQLVSPLWTEPWSRYFQNHPTSGTKRSLLPKALSLMIEVVETHSARGLKSPLRLERNRFQGRSVDAIYERFGVAAMNPSKLVS